MAMPGPASDAWVIFQIDELQLAIDLPSVKRVVRAVEIAPLPEAPRGVRGVINLHGNIIPVFDLRLRFGLPAREVRASDHLVIARTRRRTVALLVDSVAGVIPRKVAHLTPSADVIDGLETITGVMTVAGSMVLVHDLELFLCLEDEEALQKLLPISAPVST
jgi:purine-binding chemotaxis protein CheW